MPEPDVAATLAVLDWRRRTHDLYRAVRAEADPSAGHALWRAGRDDLLATHPASPLPAEERSDFTGLPVTTYDGRYRAEVAIEPADEGPDGFDATTGTDGVVPFRRLGRVRFTVPDGEVALDVWRLASYAGGLFLPVRDGTSGATTFGGGRYLLDTVKGADLGRGAVDGTVVVDLNFAYNPPAPTSRRGRARWRRCATRPRCHCRWVSSTAAEGLAGRPSCAPTAAGAPRGRFPPRSRRASRRAP